MKLSDVNISLPSSVVSKRLVPPSQVLGNSRYPRDPSMEDVDVQIMKGKVGEKPQNWVEEVPGESWISRTGLSHEPVVTLVERKVQLPLRS